MHKHASEGAPAPRFRFSQMHERKESRQLGDDVLRALADAMVRGSNRRSGVPAGYTYLGQFIAHDLSFMRDDSNRRRRREASGASPRLDLDSLYGLGLDDPAVAGFYDGARLRVGTAGAAGRAGDERPGFDLPRGGGDDGREALIPDVRNDENVAVAQTHLAFMRFHNAVVEGVGEFAAARELVTLHYQWVIRWDYLPRVCSPLVLDDVFANGRKAFEPDAAPDETPTMPVEFAAAAFRFGHSQIRRNYNWNAVLKDGAATLDRLFSLSATGGDLAGHDRLPSSAIADFRRLYDFGRDGRVAAGSGAAAGDLNFAMRIDTAFTSPLINLPDSTFQDHPPRPGPHPRRNLAFRDLKQAKRLDLATGQQMVEFLADRGVRVTELSEREILEGDPGARLNALTDRQRAAIARDTPLLFCVLREAELNGGLLTGVGAQIIAETFHRAMEGSDASIVRQPDWRPSFGGSDGRFGMVELLRFASPQGFS